MIRHFPMSHARFRRWDIFHFRRYCRCFFRRAGLSVSRCPMGEAVAVSEVAEQSVSRCPMGEAVAVTEVAEQSVSRVPWEGLSLSRRRRSSRYLGVPWAVLSLSRKWRSCRYLGVPWEGLSLSRRRRGCGISPVVAGHFAENVSFCWRHGKGILCLRSKSALRGVLRLFLTAF